MNERPHPSVFSEQQRMTISNARPLQYCLAALWKRIAVIAVLFSLTASSVLASPPPIVLENDFLRAEFSADSGALTQLVNKKANLKLITAPPTNDRAWAILLGSLRLLTDYTDCQTQLSADGQQLHLQWQTNDKITVTADVKLERDSDQLQFKCSANNIGSETIVALRYPDIQGIGRLSEDGQNDRLLHSTMMGAVFKRPFDLFLHDHAIPQGKGMFVSRYPNGFHGSATQLMAYYVENQGGFYIAAEDGQAADKDLNFFKATADSLTCELTHLNWDARPGVSLNVDYPITIAAMQQGSWYEAANRYRAWAVKQPWCQRGTIDQRLKNSDASDWLVHEIGAAGMWWPFRSDITTQIKNTRELFGKPILHLELWWQNKESLEEARAGSDKFGPFYFPYLAQSNKPPYLQHQHCRMEPKTTSITPDWIAMCPACKAWRTQFIQSAEDMVGTAPLRNHQIWMEENRVGCDADCLYFDIGPCAGIPTHCYSSDHGHTPGAGRQITQAHRSLLETTQEVASKIKQAYVPLGTECISEPFIDRFDFYYPRNSGFGMDMELLPYVRQLTWLPDGHMEVVPLFAYIYHEYGPLAIQGVNSIDPIGIPDAEAYSTWAEARSYLWGGIINTFPIADANKISDSRKRFLRSLASARTGFAKEYLSAGRMQPSPDLSCSQYMVNHGLGTDGWVRKVRFSSADTALKGVGLNDLESSQGKSDAEKDLSVERWVKDMLAAGATAAQSQSITVPSIISAAYTLDDDRLGILLVNLISDRSQSLDFKFDPTEYGLPTGDYAVHSKTASSQLSLGNTQTRTSIPIQIPPREVVLIEFIPAK
jgi:hypothetical protein